MAVSFLDWVLVVAVVNAGVAVACTIWTVITERRASG
jgi:hypothetical protein